MATEETFVVRQSPLKILLFMVVGALFVACGALMISDPDGTSRHSAASMHFWGWACVIGFGLGDLILAARLVWPPKIVLTPIGFTMKQRHRQDHYAWRSVAMFHVWTHRGARVAAWSLHDDAPEFGVGARFSRDFGADGSVRSGWEKSPEDIATLLQDWKNRYAPEPQLVSGTDSAPS